MQLKTIANTVAFQSLLVKLKKHTKVKHIDYTTLSMQPYLKCEIFSSKEAILLTSLRSHCLRGIKGNFKKMYQNNLYCPLKCDTVNQPEDTQSHIFLCQGLKKPQDNINVNLDLMTGSVQEQHKLVKQFFVLHKRRLKKLEEQEDISSSSRPQQQGAAAVPSVQLLG